VDPKEKKKLKRYLGTTRLNSSHRGEKDVGVGEIEVVESKQTLKKNHIGPKRESGLQVEPPRGKEEKKSEDRIGKKRKCKRKVRLEAKIVSAHEDRSVKKSRKEKECIYQRREPKDGPAGAELKELGICGAIGCGSNEKKISLLGIVLGVGGRQSLRGRAKKMQDSGGDLLMTTF